MAGRRGVLLGALLGLVVVASATGTSRVPGWGTDDERPEPTPMTDEEYARLEPTDTYDVDLDDVGDDDEGLQYATGVEAEMGDTAEDAVPPVGPSPPGP